MAITKYGVNDSLAVKAWSKTLSVEALKATEIRPLMGESKSSIIMVKNELKKTMGDKITYGLRMQLTGDGVTENQVQEGNEESLTTYSDALYINELMHAVRVKNNGHAIDNQRVLFNVRREARDGLTDWFSKRYSVTFFNVVAGYTAQSDTKYTGLNAVSAPSANRIVIAEDGSSNDEDLDSNDTFNLTWIDYVKEKAITADPQIRPIKIGGQDKYVLYLHPYQVTDMRTNTSTGQWLDIEKAAMQGGKVSKNPIYTGAIGEYNGVILRWSHDVPKGVNSSTGAAIDTVRRAVFLGAQAACHATGKDNGPTSYKWVEETFDYKRELGVSVQSIFGQKKSVFNSEDFGVIVLSTYAAAHT
jgi:N4-gp56 family major capsid protein